LHEAQVAPGGARGSRTFSIEHLELKSERPDLASRYDNVVYACSRCNLARGTTPRCDDEGRMLLDPCDAVWVSHFVLEDDELRGITEHGTYTADKYDVNSPTKVGLRAELREALDEAMTLLRDTPSMLEELMADLPSLPLARQETRLRIIEQLHRDLRRAHKLLHRLQAVPVDRDEQCRCKSTAHHSLPDWLMIQILDVTLT
jgi:hypothetical protein